MKVFWTVFIIVFILNCLISESEAKKVKGEKVKAEKVKEKVIHKHVKPTPDQPRDKIVKTVNHVEKPADHTIEEVEIIEKVAEKKPFKLRPPKTLSEYEKCKLECKKKRDQVSAQDYVEQLTEELKLAKENLAAQEREAAEKEASNVPHSTNEIPSITDHTENIPIVEEPIIEVTHHQTVKDEV